MALAAALGTLDAQTPTPTPRVTFIGYLRGPGDTAASDAFRRGVDLGIAEATHAGMLLGRRVRLAESAAGAALIDAAEQLRREGVQALVASPSVSARALAAWTANAELPVVVVDTDASAGCSPFLFHIGPPPITAAALLSATAPQQRPTAKHSVPSADLRVALWHPSLERFGAAQLSERYRSRYGNPMTSEAWAGWMAVKIIWESSLRTRDEPAGLRDAIARGGFDGHKGRALRFGADHVLRQPLVVVRVNAGRTTISDSIVAEVPWADERSAGGTAVTSPDVTTACGGKPA
jgi:hypothetical protein